MELGCAQSRLTLGEPMDCSLPGSTIHGILQGRILEWVAMPSSRDLPYPGTELPSLECPALQVDSLLLSHWGHSYTQEYLMLKPLVFPKLPPNVASLFCKFPMPEEDSFKYSLYHSAFIHIEARKFKAHCLFVFLICQKLFIILYSEPPKYLTLF